MHYMGFSVFGGESWKRDILVAYAQESQEHHAPEVYVKRISAKEVLVLQEREHEIFMRKMLA